MDPCSGHLKVRIADGSLSPIAGKGFIVLSKDITLNSVLHVPKLSCCLLFVSKIPKDSNVKVVNCPNIIVSIFLLNPIKHLTFFFNK